ncbi:hypothetical protein KTO58_05605 [Chitinophaga pendula]|uniref:hypothetical protein n=1 Tax=Chitinophaga TaxID=79328 RepID=UPI000BB04C54|nr:MULTISPECIES: hypothetical protein [Chitinophaga]ASZ13722.1 hypothetical protein CK934_23570 [Chitinophaga sp. MD30]UCJ08661.1 hypothetical protein KTO58_05605 [Chitinophaga pendula]
MRLIVCLGVLLCFSFAAFSQNNQIKLYVQQIAANKVYIELLHKGYNTARKGLNFIGGIKNGHFKLDKDFFLSLESINPKIRNYSRIAEIVRMGIDVSNDFKDVVGNVRGSNLFAAAELRYVDGVKMRMLDKCVRLLDDLIPLVTAGKMELSDDERIKRIDGVYIDMEDCYLFTRNFCSSTKVQVLQRQKELHDVQVMKKVNN